MKCITIVLTSLIAISGCTSTTNNIESPPPTSRELVDSLGTRDEPLVCDVLAGDNKSHLPSHCTDSDK